jgi:hypothetical protein
MSDKTTKSENTRVCDLKVPEHGGTLKALPNKLELRSGQNLTGRILNFCPGEVRTLTAHNWDGIQL